MEKPNYLKPNMEKIPQELKDYNQWVLWKGVYKPEKEKWDKEPFTINDYHASTTNPKTWGSFEDVRNVYFKNGHKFDGIGFVLTRDDPFTGWDFDNCRNNAGRTDAYIKESINSLNSYSEVSPSGTGYRVLVKATLPPNGRKKGAIECYQDGRYLTITGQCLDGTPKTIEKRQEETTTLHGKYWPIEKKVESVKQESIRHLDDHERLEKAFNSVNGDKIRRLYNGNISDYPSQSEADQALCNHLAFYLDRDLGRIDQAFRASGLYRDKWDNKHYSDGRTYGQETINKAISSCTDVYQDAQIGKIEFPKEGKLITETTIKKWEFVTMSTEMNFPKSINNPVIGGGILPAEGHMLIAGASGVGKSLLRLQLSIHIAFGVDFLGFEIPQQRKVAVFQYENTVKQEHERIHIVCGGLGIPVLDNSIIHAPRDRRFELFYNKSDRKKLFEMVKATEAEVILYDPLSTFHATDENSNSNMRVVMEVFSDINAKLGTAAIVIHHFGKFNPEKGFTSRGAQSIADWAGTEIHFTEIKGDPEREMRKLEFKKVRDKKKPNPIIMERDDYLILREAEESSICPPKKVREILESIGGIAKTQKIFTDVIEAEFNCVRNTALKCIKNAVEFGTITETKAAKGKSIQYTC